MHHWNSFGFTSQLSPCFRSQLRAGSHLLPVSATWRYPPGAHRPGASCPGALFDAKAQDDPQESTGNSHTFPSRNLRKLTSVHELTLDQWVMGSNRQMFSPLIPWTENCGTYHRLLRHFYRERAVSPLTVAMPIMCPCVISPSVWLFSSFPSCTPGFVSWINDLHAELCFISRACFLESSRQSEF